MAEEQAYHVNKGLECIKSLKASPPDLSTIKDALESWREGLSPSGRATPNPDTSEGDHQNINQSCSPAIGSDKVDMSPEDNLGFREITCNDSEAGLGGVLDKGSNSQVQRYYVYSHGGEEIEGLEDADSLVVQANPPVTDTFNGGEDGSDDSDVDSGPDDPGRDPLYDRGSAAGNDVSRSTDVEKLEGDDIQEVLNSQKSKGGRFQGGKILRVPEIPDVKNSRPSAQSIKKGHRRELSLIWNGDRVFIDKWCNPSCARVQMGVIRAKCVCGECPQICEECKDDPGVDTRIWYHSITDSA
nr:V protein [Peste des petits ruminants virus]UXG78340.1 V protein [Peste des petits ruminants virus]UXG78348.1 V protein [Peste des petits ruminants virus]UXG78356.1 V protein [Peste des petits ruminants virus]UXG78364.1 V protein [Peste des petits ruminants virus]